MSRSRSGSDSSASRIVPDKRCASSRVTSLFDLARRVEQDPSSRNEVRSLVPDVVSNQIGRDAVEPRPGRANSRVEPLTLGERDRERPSGNILTDSLTHALTCVSGDGVE